MREVAKRCLGFVPVPVLLLIMGILYFVVKPSLFFEPSWLLPVTNTLFVTIVCFIIAYIAARNYRTSGRIQILLLGCGVFAFGVAAVLAAFLRSVPGKGANLNVTVYNTGALVAAIFHFVAALILLSGISQEAEAKRKGLWAIGSYVGLAVFIGLFTIASLRGMIPPFFVQGMGATPLRQDVLGTADVLFVFSFLIFMGAYLRNRETFLYWYASALALTSISLTGFLIQSAVGSPIGWASRFSQYLGGFYFLIAVVSAIRGAHARQTSFDTVLTTALSPAEEKFRALSENSPNIVTRFDREMRHIYVNQAGAGLYGRPAGSIMGRTIRESGLPPDYCTTLQQGIERVFETGQPTQMEGWVPAGETAFFYQSRCVPEYGPDGGVANVLVISRDLTDRRRAEEVLAEAERKYRELVQYAPAAIYEIDFKGKRFSSVNDAMCLMLGRSREELLASNPLDIMDEESKSRFQERIAKWQKGEKPDGQVEYKVKTKDGRTLVATLNVTFTTDENGQPLRATVIAHDVTERRWVEDALRDSRAKLQAALASMSDAVFISDAEGRFVEFNDAFATYHRFKDKDECYKTLAEYADYIDVYFPDGTLAPLDMWAVPRALRGEIVSNAEYMLRRKDTGETWWGSYNFAPIRDKNGHIVGSVVTGRDITQSKRAGEVLRESKASLDLALQSAEMGAWYWDIKEDKRYFDGQVCRLLGIDPSTFAGSAKEFFDSVHPDDREKLQTALSRTIDEDVLYDPEYRVTWPDGTIHQIAARGRLVRDDAGRPARINGIIWDITERKAIEEALKSAHGELEQRVQERTRELSRQARLLDLTEDAVFVRDREDRITFWNRGATDLYGWTQEEAVDKTPNELLKTKFPRDLDGVNQVLSTLGRWEGELRHATKSGRVVTVSSRMVRWDESGIPAGTLEVNRDITAQKEAESQLRQAQKMEALGTMSGGIAHDFNNILAAIIGFSELLEGHVAKESRDARHLGRIMEAGIRGRELVRQMLAFSRKSEQDKRPLPVSDIVKETVKLLRATTPATISIRVNASNEALILGDRTQIQQVLMNLCTNATYAMREKGGSLDIELSEASVSASNGNPHGIDPGLYVKLTVRDTGTGMPPDIMDKIFDPFFTTKGLGEGTGLGLSVVHGIVKQHEGSITVESEPGKGSVFTVYFPRITGGPVAAAVHDDALPTGSERILFVDDEEALVEMGEDILAELGYDVTSRMNGREALELLKEDPSRFDLVITDQTMPEMTGVELAKEVLAIRSDMPIIMCTGFSYVVDADKAMAAGIKAFAMKPLTKREIARTIRKALDE